MNEGTSMWIPSDIVQEHSSAALAALPKDFYHAAESCADRRFYSAKNYLKCFFYKHGLKKEFSAHSEKMFNSLKRYYNFVEENIKRLINKGKYSSDYPVKDYIYYDFIDLFLWARTPIEIISTIEQY